MKSLEKIITKAKRKFVKHKWIFVCIKEDAFTPYEKSFFNPESVNYIELYIDI